jgi:DNA-binding transcriptional regulator YdaS (Cro superfamily)
VDLKSYFGTEKGTAKKLAELLGVSKSYMSQMASGDAPISPERAVQIEQATGCAVTRIDLFPENWERIWPELRESHSSPA